MADARALNARIDALSERYGAFFSESQLDAFYRLLDRSVRSACRWLERCVRQLPADPIDYTALPGEAPVTITSRCWCGQPKKPRAEQCRACYDAARQHAVCACGEPATVGNRCGVCHRLAAKANLKRWRARQQAQYQAATARLRAEETAARQGRAA